jgi:hypothetical protein
MYIKKCRLPTLCVSKKIYYFARVLGAKMIEYCLEREIESHWDAANPDSVKLALKLGFTDPESYKSYYWRKNT